jgi:hypothetical protein
MPGRVCAAQRWQVGDWTKALAGALNPEKLRCREVNDYVLPVSMYE